MPLSRGAGNSHRAENPERAGFSVEGHGSLAAVTTIDGGDEGIGEIGAVPIFAQRRPRYLMVFDLELGGPQNLFQRQRHLPARVAVSRFERPDHLAQHDPIDKAGIFRQTLVGDESGGLSRLFGIVLHEVTDEDVGVDSGRRRPARLRIAVCISSSETLRGAGTRSPFSSRASTVAGTRTTLPSASTTNWTLSPALSFKCRRISPGIVVCPLLVIVEAVISLRFRYFLTLILYILSHPLVRPEVFGAVPLSATELWGTR